MLGWASLTLAAASALVIVADMTLRGYRQRMWIMHLVYPITALHWGPATLWFYLRHGRRTSRPAIEREDEPDPEKAAPLDRLGHGRQPLRRRVRPG
ncbi:hypothetical protein OOK58_09220 [Streptomyces sp. NBC_01728]|uniref:hypothetical protein n=1 Tax=unclassified Streptomyces TaxID=2593676 RepID=UPI002253F7E5|nr:MULTISPECIES: hypothetical protein [unclassified Streptomyces]MCX4452297.1 hypothetical protein [Streptomyces sp. NBC_01719]MCX4491657.1 hypothetical protein [Streptomyces sp. NBC_01728]